MEIIEIKDLENLTFNKHMIGSIADFYTCSFNGKNYVYKDFYDINDSDISLFNGLSEINQDFLTTPAYLVKKEKISGYLTDYLLDYKTLFKSEEDMNIVNLLKRIKQRIIDMHNVGIVHCDLHPANIMYNGSDIKIIDFDRCQYKGFFPIIFSKYVNEYCEKRPLDYSVDIFIFNISTLAILYNVFYRDVLDYDFIEHKHFTNEDQIRTWQKIKKLEKLTYDDFLINYY